MSYGWDFAPELLTVGLWDDVLLHTTGPAAIVGVRVLTRPTSDGALAVLELDVDVAEPAALVAGAVVSGPDGGPVAASTVDWSAPAGRTRQRLRLALPAAERWEPWERGRAALYRVAIELRADGALSDRCEERFGIRTVAVTAPAGRGQGAPADDCVGLVVNGRTLFLRGANWTPNDALLGRLRDEDYRQRIEQAKAANINLLRVWGGGLREREAFYRACDEAGMLVWQEFPFSVAFFDRFPREPGYLALVEDECRGIVRALRNHPSVALWCGGNEFSPRRNRPVVDAIARAVAREDGSRPFRAASPGPGERHHWRVWHGKANVADYRKEDAPLLSEFGLQAPPNLESLRLALPEDERPGPSWEAHSAQLEKLRRYARTSAANVPTFIAASQRAQAVGLQVAIEHVRRRKGATTGTLFWQLNEPWPAITWSVIDYYGRPKLAYERLRGCYAPILVSLEYPLAAYHAGDVLRGTLWIVNDTPDTLDRLEVTAAVDGTEVLRRMAVAAPNAATRLGEVALRLPSAGTLTVRARRRGHVLSENVYDLGWHDPLGIRPLDAIRDWTTWRVLH
jgi:beta-mannosidase